MNYFTKEEISCPCCGLFITGQEASDFLKHLNNAREMANIPFKVNSWTRCETHNKNIKGSPTSSHMKGIACDIRYKGNTELYIIMKALIENGFNRLLIYPRRYFIHVDSDIDKDQYIIKVME